MKYTLSFLFFSLMLSSCSSSIKHKTGLRLETEANYVGASRYYREAANKGDDKSQNSLGNLYLSGNGVNKNYKMAMQWFLKAAKQNNADSINNIGYMHRNGLGVKKDYAEAKKWYQRAANLGNPKAKKNLNNLIAFMKEQNSHLASFNTDSNGKVVSSNPPKKPLASAECVNFRKNNINNPGYSRLMKNNGALMAQLRSEKKDGTFTKAKRIIYSCLEGNDKREFLRLLKIEREQFLRNK